MKNVEKGKLTIRMDEFHNLTVIFQMGENTVWMDKNELCELFDVYMPEIESCLDTIFKKDILHVEKVCKYHMVVKGCKIVYDITEVNLEVIVAMAFYLNCPNARILREWIMERFLKNEKFLFPDLSIDYGYSLN